MKNLTLGFLLMLGAGACRVNTTIVYPDRMQDKGTAEMFAEGVVSTDGFQHSAVTISPDGRIALWSNVTEGSWNGVIMEMVHEKGEWSAPRRVSFSDTTSSDIYPSLTPDGRTLYFSSSRKLPDGNRPRGNHLWKVERTESGWGSPVPIDTASSRNNEYASSVDDWNNVYFTSGPFRSRDWNIKVSMVTAAGRMDPINLNAMNTPGYEDGPFIATDGSYLIFESDRPGGIEGSLDLYISFHSRDGWLPPVNMGPKINTGASERFGRVSPDGKYLFFGSNRRVVNGKQNFDVYWIGAEVIEELRGRR